ncbi:hypothetical protein [Actinoplanes philippinensis]
MHLQRGERDVLRDIENQFAGLVASGHGERWSLLGPLLLQTGQKL